MRGVPKLLRRKSDGLAYVTYRSNGKKNFEYFGPFGSQRARAGYADFVRRWRDAHAENPSVGLKPGCTLLELVDAHLRHARAYYVRTDGTPTNETGEFVRVYQVLLKQCGGLAAADFRPKHFKEVRQALIESGVCLRTVNQRAQRIRRLFWWAVAEDLVEPSVAQALTAVKDLPSGRGLALEHAPVEAVAWETVEATLPFLASDQLRAIVLFQWHTGCRPGEACSVRGCDIYRDGIIPVGRHGVRVPEGVWVYRVAAKMAHARATAYQLYAIGPQARAVLEPWLRENPEEYLWQPIEAETKRQLARRTSHYRGKRRKHPQIIPGDHYDSGYRKAITAACEQAGVSHWHPHSLRHAAEQRIEREYGVEGARTVLGHMKVNTTVLYSDRDLQTAAEIAAKLG